MDDLLHQTLSLRLGESPSEGLQSRANLQFLVRRHKEMFDLCEIQGRQIFQTHNHVLLLLLLLLLLLMLLWYHLLVLEPILQLLLHGTHFLLKRVVNGLILAIET
jgi:hypothetical protein